MANKLNTPLSALIEVIIEKGSITREEQLTINMLADKSSINQQDSISVNQLISMISEGKIEVMN